MNALKRGTHSERMVTLQGSEGDLRSGDTLAMCHRLCSLCTYVLKAHVREMSTPPKLTFWHGTPLPFFTCCHSGKFDQ